MQTENINIIRYFLLLILWDLFNTFFSRVVFWDIEYYRNMKRLGTCALIYTLFIIVASCNKISRKIFRARTLDIIQYNMRPLGEVVTEDYAATICQVLCAGECTGFMCNPSTTRCQLLRESYRGGGLEADYSVLYIAKTKNDPLTCTPLHVMEPELLLDYDDLCK